MTIRQFSVGSNSLWEFEALGWLKATREIQSETEVEEAKWRISWCQCSGESLAKSLCVTQFQTRVTAHQTHTILSALYELY